MEFRGQEARRKSNWEHETQEMAGCLGVGLRACKLQTGWPRRVLLPACSQFVRLG